MAERNAVCRPVGLSSGKGPGTSVDPQLVLSAEEGNGIDIVGSQDVLPPLNSVEVNYSNDVLGALCENTFPSSNSGFCSSGENDNCLDEDDLILSDFKDEEGLLLEQLENELREQSAFGGEHGNEDSALDGVSLLFSDNKYDKAVEDHLDVEQIGVTPVRNNFDVQSLNLSLTPTQNNPSKSSQSFLSDSLYLDVPLDCFAGKGVSNCITQDGILPLSNTFKLSYGERGVNVEQGGSVHFSQIGIDNVNKEDQAFLGKLKFQVVDNYGKELMVQLSPRSYIRRKKKL